MRKRVVSGVRSVKRSPAVSELTAPSAEDFAAAVSRFQRDFSRMLRTVAGEATKGSGPLPSTRIARTLGLQVPLCHRLVASVDSRLGPGETLSKMPGVEGLELVVEAAAETAMCEPKLIRAARVSIGTIADLITRCGGSASQMREVAQSRLGGVEASWALKDREAQRRAAFDGMSQALGCRCESEIKIDLVCKLPGPEARYQMVGVTGRTQVVRAVGGMPLTNRHVYQHVDDSERESALLADARWRVLTARFTTPDVQVRSEAVQDSSTGLHGVFEVFDPEWCTREPLDVFSNPLRSGVKVLKENRPPAPLNSWVVPHIPARRLLLDVYIHKSLASRCQPSTGVFLAGGVSPPPGSLRNRASTRVCEPPIVQLLGAGLAHVGWAGNDRHAEFVTAAFEAEDQNAGDFMGYRVEVMYPIPMVEYTLGFEFI